MTEKELLYIEDALGHLKHMMVVCDQYKSMFLDTRLNEYVENYGTLLSNMFDHLMGVLKGCVSNG